MLGGHGLFVMILVSQVKTGPEVDLESKEMILSKSLRLVSEIAPESLF